MDLPSTPLFAPPSLPYPITIQRILTPDPNTTISKTQALFSYSYNEKDGDKLVKVYESPIEGSLKSWNVKKGEKVLGPSFPIVYIQEPCTHDVQLHGLCALCGKDLTGTDYTGFSETSRAKIAMVHDVGGLTVSLEEASRLEAATSSRLLSAKKLSLIVDLDQTIVHATVDPTVGEWLSDATNPNHPMLEGVQRFTLGMTSGDVSADDGCVYYVKKRPGLDEFLKELSQIYEMHVYTMGTRAYAVEVCQVIDPDGSLFGKRILSRDESGSLTRKSLQRLFPCDDHMVVIIDDRADVWDGIPNLVKVIPYEFFVGIGDINSAFLPPTTNQNPLIPIANEGKVGEDKVVSPSLVQAEAETANTLSEQIENRPLAVRAEEQALKKGKEKEKEKEREELDSDDDDDDDEDDEDDEDEDEDGDDDEKQDRGDKLSGAQGELQRPQQEAVLKDDDRELDRLFEILKSIRDTFYQDSSASNPSTPPITITSSSSDVKLIIPSMKRRALSSTSLVFSGLVALGTPAHQSDWWKLATSFGATCSESISTRTTHLIAKEAGTAKVHQALKIKGLKVVKPNWLLDCAAHWKKLDEEVYLLMPSKGKGGNEEKDAEEEEEGNEEEEEAEFLRMMEEGTRPDAFDGLTNGAEVEESDDEWLRRMAAQDDLDAGLEEVDWAEAEKEIADALGDGDYDSDASSVASHGGSGGLNGKKRGRGSTASTDDESSHRNGTTKKATSDGEAGSPLQKRVKTSRMRSSKLLKVSFPHEDALTESAPPSSSQASSKNGGGDESIASSSDDEAFFASMAAEVENEWDAAADEDAVSD